MGLGGAGTPVGGAPRVIVGCRSGTLLIGMGGAGRAQRGSEYRGNHSGVREERCLRWENQLYLGYILICDVVC